MADGRARGSRTHNWRSAAAGNLGGWQVARCLFLLNALLGAVGVPRAATFPNAWNKFVPKPIHTPPHPKRWNELTWPHEYPLAMNEMSFLLPHLLEGRPRAPRRLLHARLQPGLDQPRRFSWIEALDRRVARSACTWRSRRPGARRRYFADYVLPMGLGSERHDLHSYETARRAVDRLPPAGAEARRARGSADAVTDTREVNPGEVWEENEFWIELSWRIDPDGALGIRKHFESQRAPGDAARRRRVLRLDLRELGAGAARARARRGPQPARVHAPLRRVRDRARCRALSTTQRCPRPSSRTSRATRGRARLRRGAPKPASANVVPRADARSRRRRPAPRRDRGRRRGAARLPDAERPARVLLATLKAWGWPEHALPGYIKSHVHPRASQPGELAADPDVPPAGADPHAQREREVARRDRAHQPALDPPDDAARARRRDRRPRARRDARSATSS